MIFNFSGYYLFALIHKSLIQDENLTKFLIFICEVAFPQSPIVSKSTFFFFLYNKGLCLHSLNPNFIINYVHPCWQDPTHLKFSQMISYSIMLRVFASGFFKLFYFTFLKPTLSFILYNFISLSTSQLLFFYSTH